MGLLLKASNQQARGKVGIFGAQGTGKTTTLAMISIGLSKTYHNGAPVAMLDTENGSDFLKPIFDIEGIEFLVHKSRAFSDMVPTVKESVAAGACCFIADSVTHTWRELVETYCEKKQAQYKMNDTYSPQFQDWNYLKKEWGVWTREFLNSQIHCLVAGRGGYEYEYQTNEKGKKELIKGDSKMKAETEFGYEPNLLLEATLGRTGTVEGHGGKFEHIIYVLKDRARFLNGKEFVFPDMNFYKEGDWKTVFNSFAPHFEFLNISGQQRAISSATSDDMFDEMGDGEARQRQQARKIALEELENIMGITLWPGSTNEVKRIKLGVVKTLFGVTAWAAVEMMSLLKLENALFALQAYENITPKPEGEPAITAKVKELLESVSATKGVSIPTDARPTREKAVSASNKANVEPTIDFGDCVEEVRRGDAQEPD
jgi:hypothetical protein